MAHGTRISGTNKAVTAGFTRINGVNKKIKKGLTLVGGVQKDISFGGGACVVEITGAGNETVCYVSIDGTMYTGEATIEVNPGTVISAYAAPVHSNAGIFVNGNKVSDSNYNYTVEGNVTIALASSIDMSTFKIYGIVQITEE